MADPLVLIDMQCRQIDGLFDQLVAPETDHKSVMADLTSHLASHISVEHSVVLPAVRRTGPDGKRTWRAMRGDYRRLGRLLTLVERRKVNSPDVPDLIAALRSEWRQHSGRHSGLKAVERLPEADREELAEKVASAESVILSHPHPHLLSLGPLSRLTTRLAARFDRARDRTVQNVP